MIYSKSKNFVFIHIFKNAGTSIRNSLSSYEDTFNNRRRLDRLLGKALGVSSSFAPSNHASACKVKKYLGDKAWNNAYTFAVVRNPWDWQVSLYTYMLKNKAHFQHETITKMKSFDEYIFWRCGKHFRTQSNFLTDDSGVKLIVKDVYRFETIDSDIQRLSSHIGRDIHLKRLNESRGRDDGYRKYYSETSREMVRKFFKEDIDRFGYNF